jgi:membrane fusion protein (multidrug efflux system)
MLYVIGTISFIVWLAFIALFLHPAKSYILPGIMGQMGIAEGSLPATLLFTVLPALLTLMILALLLIPGRGGRQKYMFVLMVLGGVILTGYQVFLKSQGGGWEMPPATITAQTVAVVPFADRIEAIGTTQANESTSLTSNVTETVREINVSEGQFVTKGTVLVQLHDDEERASLIEAEKAFNRSAALVRTQAVSPARLDTDRARLDIVRAQVADRQITAPFDGILGLRSISVGDIVNPGTVITTLDDVDPIKLEFSVPESFVAAVKSGMMIEARTDAYPGQIFSGLITAIDPRIDPVTRSLKIKAEIDNGAGLLRAGMLLATDIVRNRRDGVAVSEEALVSSGEQKSVLVLTRPEGQGADQMYLVESRLVTIGGRMPGYVEVLSGLKVGEKIVVDGVIKSFPGSRVKIGGEKAIAATVDRAIKNAVPGKQDELNAIGLIETVTPAAGIAPAQKE